MRLSLEIWQLVLVLLVVTAAIYTAMNWNEPGNPRYRWWGWGTRY